jgi:hypothetical protein
MLILFLTPISRHAVSVFDWLWLIELYNNKSHGLSPPGGFSSLFFDQAVPYYSQRHLADWNAIYILHQLDCARPHVEGSGVSR